MRYEKNVEMENYLLNEVYKFSEEQFLTRYVFYVLVLNIENKKFHFLTTICMRYKISVKIRKNVYLNVYKFLSFFRYLEKN